jgi:DNA-3-methyladenine glycosylase
MGLQIKERATSLEKHFYLGDNVTQIAKDLLGKVIVTHIGGQITSGIITETEAYAGPIDKASHAYNNKRTKRTQTMFETGGIAYVYLIYGIHHLFNFVTNIKGVPHAVLLRGIIPVNGLETMQKRRSTTKQKGFTAGPGTASQALGITTAFDGVDLQGDKIWIEDRAIHIPANKIIAKPRIGVDYAGEHAKWEWNFKVDMDLFVNLP